MKKILFICLIISQTSFSQQLKLDTNYIYIGEQTTLYIECNKNETEKITWPIFKDTLKGGIEIIEISRTDTNKLDENNSIISQELIITCWDSGTYNIKPIIFNESKKTNSLILTVRNVEVKLEKAEKDIKGPMKIPFEFNEALPYILLLILILVTVYLLRRFLFRKPEKQESSEKKQNIPCHIIALKRLKKLSSEKLWQKGKLKSYHANISEIVRTYIEERYGFFAMELPTGDILDSLEKINLNKKDILDLSIILRRSDLAKFAKSKPEEDENKESMNLALLFIESTKLIIQDD